MSSEDRSLSEGEQRLITIARACMFESPSPSTRALARRRGPSTPTPTRAASRRLERTLEAGLARMFAHGGGWQRLSSPHEAGVRPLRVWERGEAPPRCRFTHSTLELLAWIGEGCRGVAPADPAGLGDELFFSRAAEHLPRSAVEEAGLHRASMVWLRTPHRLDAKAFAPPARRSPDEEASLLTCVSALHDDLARGLHDVLVSLCEERDPNAYVARTEGYAEVLRRVHDSARARARPDCMAFVARGWARFARPGVGDSHLLASLEGSTTLRARHACASACGNLLAEVQRLAELTAQASRTNPWDEGYASARALLSRVDGAPLEHVALVRRALATRLPAPSEP